MILMNNVHMKSESLTQQELILYDRIRRDINSGFTLEEAVDNLVVLYQPLPDSQKISIEKVRNVVMLLLAHQRLQRLSMRQQI